MEKVAEKGNLTGTETFMFTDNYTFEAAYHNGTSLICN